MAHQCDALVEIFKIVFRNYSDFVIRGAAWVSYAGLETSPYYDLGDLLAEKARQVFVLRRTGSARSLIHR